MVTNIFGRMRLTCVINATGAVTRLGASPIDPEVIADMAAAAPLCVDIAEPQASRCAPPWPRTLLQSVQGAERRMAERSCALRKTTMPSATWRFGRLPALFAKLWGEVPGLNLRTITDAAHAGLPLVAVDIGPDAVGVAARPSAATPSIHVDATTADGGTPVLVPTYLRIDDAAVIAAAFAAVR